MALEIKYKCGHTANVATEGQGTVTTERACLPCALGQIEYRSDASLADLWDGVEAAVFFVHTDAHGEIVIGTKNGLYELIKVEGEKQNLAPHQLILLATLTFLSSGEVQKVAPGKDSRDRI